jgi:excinuclease UvrABC nuclease subunit
MVKFSRTQKFTKENINKVSGETAIVYKLKNSAGKNIYTGEAGRWRGPKRLLEHKEVNKEKIPGATKFQVANVKNREAALKLEKQIIKKEDPKFNKQK